MKNKLTMSQLKGILFESGDIEDLPPDSSYEDIMDVVDDGSFESFCKDLSVLITNPDPKVQALYQTFKKGWKAEYKNIKVTHDKVPIMNLRPTQNVIYARKSLSLILNGKWRMPGVKFAVDALLSEKNPYVQMGDPIVICNVNGADYLIDGHHRWSKAYAFNPGCFMDAYIIDSTNYFETSDDVLKFAQGTLGATGKNPINDGQPENDYNLYEITPQELISVIRENLNPEVLEHIIQAPLTKGMIVDQNTLYSYLWGNVQTLYRYAPQGAHDREYMPQFPDKNTNPRDAVERIAAESKVTMTFGQLSKLLEEARTW